MLLTGFVSDETLACLYAGAVIVRIAVEVRGFGLPAVEAAAAGTPLVLSDIPAHRETLGEAAAFFPPGDAQALAERLVDLLRDGLGSPGGEPRQAACGGAVVGCVGSGPRAVL